MIEINGRHINPPQWNDLDRRMLLNCYTMMGLPSLRGADVEVKWKRLVQSAWILGIDQAFLDEWQRDCIRVHGEEGKEIYLNELDTLINEATQHLWEDTTRKDDDDNEIGPKTYSIALTLTACPYPEIKVNGVTLHAPADGWSNMSLYEYGMAWEYINAYIRTGDDNMMLSLLAVLYRPAKEDTPYNLESGYEGDIRQPIRRHEPMIASRAQSMKVLPSMVQAVITFWAICCRHAIYKQYIDVFGEPDDNNDEEELSGSGWPEVIMDLAGNIVDIDRVSDQNIHNVMMYLRKRKEDARRRKIESDPNKE